MNVGASEGFRQNSVLAADFGQEREEKQPRFESETKCREDRIRRLIGPGLRALALSYDGATWYRVEAMI